MSWAASATEVTSTLAMLLGARQPFIAAMRSGPCSVVDLELVGFAFVVCRLPGSDLSLRVALRMRDDIDHPKSHAHADLLAWGDAWMAYRRLIVLGELAAIERHNLMTAEQVDAWQRGAS